MVQDHGKALSLQEFPASPRRCPCWLEAKEAWTTVKRAQAASDERCLLEFSLMSLMCFKMFQEYTHTYIYICIYIIYKKPVST